MTKTIRGTMVGSAPGKFSSADAVRVAWTALFVATSAVLSWFVTSELPEISEQFKGSTSLAITAILTPLLQAALKFFTDTRNIPAAAPDSVVSHVGGDYPPPK